MERLSVIAAAQRRIENGKAVLDCNENADHQKDRRHDHRACQRKHEVQHALGHAIVKAPVAVTLLLFCFIGYLFCSHTHHFKAIQNLPGFSVYVQIPRFSSRI